MICNSNFKACDLSSTVFKNNSFDSILFHKVDLSNMLFDDQVLTNVEFKGCGVKNMSFRGATLKNIKFSAGFTLTGKFYKQLATIDFKGAKMDKVTYAMLSTYCKLDDVQIV